MRKILSLLGGISIMSLPTTSIISCEKKEDYMFTMKIEGGKPIDSFDKRSVEDYFFGYNSGNPYPVTEVFIKFKDKDLKVYGQLSGGLQFWLGQLVRGLGFFPNQEKYKDYDKWVEPIPEWAWKSAALWDWDKNEPHLPK